MDQTKLNWSLVILSLRSLEVWIQHAVMPPPPATDRLVRRQGPGGGSVLILAPAAALYVLLGILNDSFECAFECELDDLRFLGFGPWPDVDGPLAPLGFWPPGRLALDLVLVATFGFAATCMLPQIGRDPSQRLDLLGASLPLRPASARVLLPCDVLPGLAWPSVVPVLLADS